MVEQAPYGAWRSPITADLIVKREAEHFFFSFEVFRSRLGFLGPKETAAVKGEVS
jgi:hypothetical protein